MALGDNNQSILQISFDGSLSPGERPPPDFEQLGKFVRCLERLLAHVAARDGLAERGVQWQLSLIDAARGSLDVWCQLVAVAGGVVTTLADGPQALTHLLDLLVSMKEATAKGQRPRAKRISYVSPQANELRMLLRELRRSVKSAGHVTLRSGDIVLILEDADFGSVEESSSPAEQQ